MLNTILLIGLSGAILMFIGDMVLYYSKDDYVADGTLNPIIDIMKTESRTRLYIGGLIGPVAAFLYCIGYYHLVLVMNEQYQILGWVCFLINCLGIICGGVYHSHCAYFGLQGLGFLLLAMFIVLKWTVFSRWMIVVSPGILFLFSPFTRKLPKGLHMIIGGGWTNLISVIYYGVALMVLYFG